MKYFKTIISFMALSIIFNACQEDFLDRHPLDQVTSVDYFKSTNDMKVYLNQFYKTGLFPRYGRWGNDFGSDNSIRRLPDSRLEGTRTINTSGSISFADVRRINYFFDNYKNIEEYADFDEYKTYLGEAYFFRALIYFNLLKSYGDIQWVTTELQPDSPELFKPRDPRNIVADNIIANLDSAAMYLTDNRKDGASRVHKWMALQLQSRVALYEGTWQKYHAGTPFGVSNPQPEKYFNKVVEATTEIMDSELFNLYSNGKPNEDYYDLYSTIQDHSSVNEVLFWLRIDLSIGFISEQRNYRMEVPDGNSFTKELADAYLCTDGKPISGNALFQGYATISDELQNRDPRMEQSFTPPDAVWKANIDGTTEYWSYLYDRLNEGAEYDCPAGYIIRKGYDPDMNNHVYANEETPSIIFRYGEVLLNYAEAKAELGTIIQEDIDKSVKLLRDRVGMPNLILADITVDPDWDFPTLSPVINEIRRERRVELVAEGLRWDDIARWAAADELIINKRPRGFLASQIAVNPFPVDDDGFLDPYKNIIPVGYEFKLDRDYLNSIPVSEIVLNPNMDQNPGWD